MHTALSLLTLASASSIWAQRDVPLSEPLQRILANTGAPLYQYPTQLTQDIVPKAIHSHNDYWRQIPLYSALSVGAVSVESDVWLVNGTLYVGHELSALTPERTFESLYIDPLVSILEAQNPPSRFVTGVTDNGVFDAASSQTFYLWIDIKTDGATAWPAAVRALEPLRQRRWLTTVSGNGTVHPGPVTVIGTGNTPLAQVQGVSPRDYFWDAPIPTLGTTFSNITSSVSPVASTSFARAFGSVRTQGLNGTQLSLLRSQVATAKSKGIRTRYWELPLWPVGTRNAIWRQLYDEGVDLLNVDDLEAAANFWDGDNF
ncbi:Altered inheritance of mitochondria protein 6 [Sphaceloma murrayae]|uniref:Altered inheritance of mitochondria protein 6 n=1 Tax=Sphaceloma murrayae TaxID=2082308 RepID=A0A2K1R1F8_9PEZI|nr:Altered inheritance of mitochondria protein 6 [Sphaceloma murrayae]